MLLVAVLFIGTLLVLPLTGGQAITPQSAGPAEYLFRAYVALLALGFFGLPWTRRGQTLGMMAWKLRVERVDGRRLDWRGSALRLAVGAAFLITAMVGLWLMRSPVGSLANVCGIALVVPVFANYLWMGFDPQARTLHDLWTRCRVVQLL
jgi:uncharacterized RDD family membrane protein YckC